jgi:hypothetical protein
MRMNVINTATFNLSDAQRKLRDDNGKEIERCFFFLYISAFCVLLSENANKINLFLGYADVGGKRENFSNKFFP